MFLSIGMLKQKYFLTDIFILSAEKQPIKLSWRKIEWLLTIQGVFYGMGRTMPPAVISVTCNYLRIPMALLFVSWGWGLPGIWWSISITSTMKGIICLIWFMLIKKKALNYQAV